MKRVGDAEGVTVREETGHLRGEVETESEREGGREGQKIPRGDRDNAVRLRSRASEEEDGGKGKAEQGTGTQGELKAEA